MRSGTPTHRALGLGHPPIVHRSGTPTNKVCGASADVRLRHLRLGRRARWVSRYCGTVRNLAGNFNDADSMIPVVASCATHLALDPGSVGSNSAIPARARVALAGDFIIALEHCDAIGGVVRAILGLV